LIAQSRANEETAAFARRLLSGVVEHKSAIDSAIAKAAAERPLMEMAAVDRNILRIAVREFLVDNLTPAGAAINEAVELAKKYGSENSPRFINGVLGAISATGKAAVQEGK